MFQLYITGTLAKYYDAMSSMKALYVENRTPEEWIVYVTHTYPQKPQGPSAVTRLTVQFGHSVFGLGELRLWAWVLFMASNVLNGVFKQR